MEKTVFKLRDNKSPYIANIIEDQRHETFGKKILEENDENNNNNNENNDDNNNTNKNIILTFDDNKTNELDLSGLTEEERVNLLSVMQRDYKLRNKDKQRIENVKDELDKQKTKFSLLSNGKNFNKNNCLNCCGAFYFLINPKLTCNSCKNFFCKNCTVKVKKPSLLCKEGNEETLCTACYQERKLRTENSWLRSRFKSKFENFGSTKVIKSLLKSNFESRSEPGYGGADGDSVISVSSIGLRYSTQHLDEGYVHDVFSSYKEVIDSVMMKMKEDIHKNNKNDNNNNNNNKDNNNNDTNNEGTKALKVAKVSTGLLLNSLCDEILDKVQDNTNKIKAKKKEQKYKLNYNPLAKGKAGDNTFNEEITEIQKDTKDTKPEEEKDDISSKQTMIQIEILRDFMRFMIHTEKFPKLYTKISVQDAIDHCAEVYVNKTSQQSINLFNTTENHTIDNYFDNYDLSEQDFEHLKKLTLEKSMTKFLPHFDSFNQQLQSHNVTDYNDDLDEDKKLEDKTPTKDKEDGFLGDEEEEEGDDFDSVDNANDPKQLLQRGRLYLNNRIPFGKFDGYGSIRQQKTPPQEKKIKKKKIERKISENDKSVKDKDKTDDNNKKNKNKKNKNDGEKSDDSFDDIVSNNIIYLPANQAQELSGDNDLKIDIASRDTKNLKDYLSTEQHMKHTENSTNNKINNKTDENNNKNEQNNNINENEKHNIYKNNKKNNNNNNVNNNNDELDLDDGSLKMFRRKDSIEEEKFQSLQYTDDGKQLTDQSTDPPRFSVAPKDKSCRPNSDVMIVCSVVGARPYGVTWYKHSKELIELDASDDRYTFASNSVQNSIRIKNVTHNDKGYYMCMAYNKYGFCQKGFRVKVDEDADDDEDDDGGDVGGVLSSGVENKKTEKKSNEYSVLADKYEDIGGYDENNNNNNHKKNNMNNNLNNSYNKDGGFNNENVQEYVIMTENASDITNKIQNKHDSINNNNNNNNRIDNDYNNNKNNNSNNNNNNNEEEIQETRFSGSEESVNDYMKIIDNNLENYKKFTSDITQNNIVNTSTTSSNYTTNTGTSNLTKNTTTIIATITTKATNITATNITTTNTTTTNTTTTSPNSQKYTSYKSINVKEPKSDVYGSKITNVVICRGFDDTQKNKKTDIDTYMQQNTSFDRRSDYTSNYSQLSDKRDKLANQIFSKSHNDGVVVDNSFDTYEEIKINKRDWKEDNIKRYFDPIDVRESRGSRPSSMLSYTSSIDSLRSLKKRSVRPIHSYNYDTNIYRNSGETNMYTKPDNSNLYQNLDENNTYKNLDDSSSCTDKSDKEKRQYTSDDFYSSLDLNSRSSYDTMSITSTDTITNTYESSREEDSYSVDTRNMEDDDRIIDFYSKSIKNYAYDNFSINSNLADGYDTLTKKNASDTNNTTLNNSYNNSKNIQNSNNNIENNKNNNDIANAKPLSNSKPIYNTKNVKVHDETPIDFDPNSGIPIDRKSLEKDFKKSFKPYNSKFNDYTSYNGANYNDYLRDTNDYLKSAKESRNKAESVYSDTSNKNGQNYSSIFNQVTSENDKKTNKYTPKSNYSDANEDFYSKKDINNNLIGTKTTKNIEKTYSTTLPTQPSTNVHKVLRNNRDVEYTSMPSVSDLRRKFDDFSSNKTGAKTAKIPRYKYF